MTSDIVRRSLPLLLALVAAAPVCAQSSWISFTETPSRLVGAPSLTGSDIEEKDYWVGDFDQDGDQDMVVVRKTPPPYQVSGPRQHVFFRNEAGFLTDRTSTLCPDFLTNLSDGRDVRGADLDNDGWEDLVVVNTFDQNPQLYMNLGNDPMGNWLGFDLDTTGRIPNLISGSLGPMFCEVAIADYDGNGGLDLYFTDYTNDLEDTLLMNDGTGYYSNQTSTRVSAAIRTSTFGTGVQTADMNNDGWSDLIRSSGAGSPNAIRVSFNSGGANPGFFMQFQDMPTNVPYMMNFLDINRDGRQDLYIVSDAQDNYVINNSTNANGSINVTSTQLNASPLTTNFGGNIKIADLDLDGWDDVVVNDVDIDLAGCDRRLTLLRNMSGTGTWQRLQDPFLGNLQNFNVQGTHDTAVLDIDGDGRQDLVVGTCTSTRVFMNNPKLSLKFRPLLTGGPGLEWEIRDGAPNARCFTLISFNPVTPATGSFFGLSSDAFVNWISLANTPPADVFLDANGRFSVTIMGALPPLTVQVRAVQGPPAPFVLSNVVTTPLN